MSTQCSSCRLLPACSSTAAQDSPLLLHAGSAILADRVAELLDANQFSYDRKGWGFRLAASTARQRLAATLRANLVAAERVDLRIAGGDFDSMMRSDDVDAFCRKLDTAWFDHALATDAFTFHFQPIVHTIEEKVFGHESLVRLSLDRLYNGGEILDAMLMRGDVHRFDSYCRQKAIRTGARQHRPGQKLFINFQPSSIYDPAHCLRSTLHALSQTHLKPSDVVFEVVETEQVQDRHHLRRIADYYRTQGFGFALDDVGAGVNTLEMVEAIQPDYVKLDKSLTRATDTEDGLRALETVVGRAHKLGCALIGEGVETADTAELLRAYGVSLQQGWHFGRPQPQMRFELFSDLFQVKQA